jgi:broad-specificity NMP kinase
MFFLVTGASGVGKTTVRKLIEAEIAGQVAVCELATLGITPEWSLRWRHQAVEHVVQAALQKQKSGTHFLLCGDPVPPGEIYAAPGAAELEGIEVCLLDISPEKQIERLSQRGDARELIPHHVMFAEWMRHHVIDHRYRPEVIINGGWERMRWHVWNSDEVTRVPWSSQIIDTTHLNPMEVAEQVLSWIKLHMVRSASARSCRAD